MKFTVSISWSLPALGSSSRTGYGARMNERQKADRPNNSRFHGPPVRVGRAQGIQWGELRTPWIIHFELTVSFSLSMLSPPTVAMSPGVSP